MRNLGRVALGVGVGTVAGTLGSPAAVLADNALAATKQSYFRYVPRIQASAANAGVVQVSHKNSKQIERITRTSLEQKVLPCAPPAPCGASLNAWV